jgi:Uma2 family endonuclease
MPTIEHGTIIVNTAIALRGLRLKGRVADSSVEYRVGEKSVFPDLSFLSFQRQGLTSSVYPTILPELVVEVTSPTDNFNDEIAKARWYLDNGANLVVYVNPALRSVLLYQTGKAVRLLNESQSFTFKATKVAVAEIFIGV